MGRLHGPNTLLQPIKQGKIVGSATKNGLAEMNVGLNKAW
jgi:hypothetical protein